jgi:VTC domain-containing protein
MPKAMRDLADPLAPFPRASTALAAQRELRRRTDSKFILTRQGAVDLFPKLSSDYAILPAGSSLVASYRTLYFDTADLDFFHAARRGRRVRHKVRIRHYPDRRVTFLEVKKRRSGILTTKTWRERDYADNELDEEDQAFVAAETGVGRRVLPQAWTGFRRVMLLGLRTNERVTIDLGLRVEMGRFEKSFGDVAIVEVKQWPYSRATPVMAALRAGGWRAGWLSKYCAAIAVTHPNVRLNELKPGLRSLDRGAA